MVKKWTLKTRNIIKFCYSLCRKVKSIFLCESNFPSHPAPNFSWHHQFHISRTIWHLHKYSQLYVYMLKAIVECVETDVIESREGFVIGWKVTSDNSIWPEIYDVLMGWTSTKCLLVNWSECKKCRNHTDVPQKDGWGIIIHLLSMF